jgi:hypothetical protein
VAASVWGGTKWLTPVKLQRRINWRGDATGPKASLNLVEARIQEDGAPQTLH